MKNIDKWNPTKFVFSNGKFESTKDTSKVGNSYRFIADIQAKHYSELIKKYASGRLLDLGCGEAALYEMYKPYVTEIFCADWPNSTHDISFLDIHLDLNYKLPLKENSFDTIILTDVLEHIKYPDILWKEMQSILKHNGKVIITVPFIHLLHEEPNDYYRYTEFKLRSFCEDNCFKILTLYPYGGALEVFIDITSKLFSKSKLISFLYYRLSTYLSKSVIGKKVYSLTSTKYPLGYCMVIEKSR